MDNQKDNNSNNNHTGVKVPPLDLEKTPEGAVLSFFYTGEKRNLGHLDDDHFQMVLDSIRVINLLYLFPSKLFEVQEGIEV